METDRLLGEPKAREKFGTTLEFRGLVDGELSCDVS